MASEQAPGYRASADERVAPEDVLVVAHVLSRGAVLGSAPDALDLEAEGDLHHRERLRCERRDGARWQCLRHRPRDVLRNVMAQLQRATAEGVPVKGNFVWSAMDNFEWSDGYGTRFGLVYVDFKTQKRTPKLSAMWYREAARRNAVV